MATERMAEARELVAKLKTEITNVTKTHSGEAPRVLCLEWLDPPFVAGHWVPEMVAIAGGVDVLGRAGEPGVPVSWKRIVSSDPDLILAMPCGYHREKIESELKIVPFPPAWYLLRAVRSGNLFAMDASSHFSRSGPRLADGIVAMAEIFRRHGSAKSRKAPSGEKKYRVRYQVGNQR
jgi:iron complex transport system substrate-binding protein